MELHNYLKKLESTSFEIFSSLWGHLFWFVKAQNLSGNKNNMTDFFCVSTQTLLGVQIKNSLFDLTPKTDKS